MDTIARIQPKLNEDITVPRDFGDYSVTVDEAGLPQGISLQKMVG